MAECSSKVPNDGAKELVRIGSESAGFSLGFASLQGAGLWDQANMNIALISSHVVHLV